MKTLQIAAYRKLGTQEYIVSSIDPGGEWSRVSDLKDFDFNLDELPYYMKNDYEIINDPKEFGLNDMYTAWRFGAIAHFQKRRLVSNFEYFIEIATKEGWIDEERI